jgi:uncharacterized Zn finger protein
VRCIGDPAMKFNLKKLFSEAILERGQDYYIEGRVSNLLRNGDSITATVQGSHRYKVSINIQTDTYRCNCPYEGRMCKHIAAVCCALNTNKNIKTAESIERHLAKKSKEELVRVMREMLAQEPRLHSLLLSKEAQIIRKINELDVEEVGDEWQEFYDYIPDRVEDILDEIASITNNKQNLLLKLLKKTQELNEKYDHHGSTEDSVFEILEQINSEKSKLPEKEAKNVETQVKKILGSEYELFTQEED